jgi:hypothetical protein
MTQIWMLFLVCTSLITCDTNTGIGPKTYSSELQCEEEGLRIVKSTPTFKQKAVLCLKVIVPN